MSTPLPELHLESISLVSAKDALDSLRSPEGSEFGGRLPERESIRTTVSELDDIALDDDELPSSPALSSVPLTPKPTSTPKSPLSQASTSLSQELDSRTKGEEDGSSERVNCDIVHSTDFSISHSNKSHQKSASITTIRSGHTISFIEEKRRSARVSLDGQHALQEEFSRLQKEKQALQEQGAEEAIDWGRFFWSQDYAAPSNNCLDFWGAVISGSLHYRWVLQTLKEIRLSGFRGRTTRGACPSYRERDPCDSSRYDVAAYVSCLYISLTFDVLTELLFRAASKDLELEASYVKLLREASPHEKSITRDLGRCGFQGIVAMETTEFPEGHFHIMLSLQMDRVSDRRIFSTFSKPIPCESCYLVVPPTYPYLG